MDAQDKFQYWLTHAQYDLDTADDMHQSGKWLYVVFMCQQAIEKLTKGLYGLYIDFNTIPRTHNIRRLINDFADKLPEVVPTDTYSFFDLLTQYYLNNRYPDYIDDLLQQIHESNAKTILLQTKEVFLWLQTMKP